MLLYNEYLSRVYGGLLGMNAGIRLGAPVEPDPWTYQRIADVFGTLDHYVAPFRRFAADDDANGPIYFIRALLDKLPDTAVSAQDVGRAWLEYTRDGHGMFWWGGVGVSTEHTAYQNLKQGIEPPRSGSAAQNGTVLAEQIGGQIFIDSWGFVCPGLPQRAADYARTAASVSHDGEGLHGAAFIAGCIAAAFTAPDVDTIVDAALALIPEDSLYAQVVRAVRRFHARQPEDWRPCMEYLLQEWGYDRYPGACHIIPNAGVCALALFYGGGDLNRSIEIASMCGWDTDCNAGSVGSILGVFRGPEGLAERYRAPMEDTIAASGISGYLNITDLPSFARELARAGCRIAGIREPEAACPPPGVLRFDFALPGSVHGFRSDDPSRCFIGKSAGGALQIVLDRVFPGGTPCRVLRPVFFRRADFDDERYEPVFSPQAYPGQLLTLRLKSDCFCGGPVQAAPCLLTAVTRRELCGPLQEISDAQTLTCTWQLPETDGEPIGAIGVKLAAPDGSCARIFLEELCLSGGGHCTLAPEYQSLEFGQLTPFSQDNCQLQIRDGRLHMTSAAGGAAFTGNYFMADTAVQAALRIAPGWEGGLLLRAKGARSYYAFGMLRDGRAAIVYRQDRQEKILAAAPLPCADDAFHLWEARAAGSSLALFVDGSPVLSVSDSGRLRGMAGLWLGADGSMDVKDFSFRFTL